MTYETHNIEQLNTVEPGYLSSFGLTEAPFSSQQDDRFLYLNPALTERLELIKHYTQYGNLLLMITGERGVGKSSLKQRFINSAQEEWQVCEIQSHTMMDASLLLKHIAHGFNITEPPLEPAAIYEVLSLQLDYMHQASYIPILIIDDAHELPIDALQALLYLAENHSEQQTALRIILFCEPQIETMLEDLSIHSLKERVTHGMEILPLDETETAEYLRHRLAVAGLDGTSPFTPKLVHKIFKASQGLPAKINEYAHQNLLDDSEPFTPEEIDENNGLLNHVSTFNIRNMLLIGASLIIVITGLVFQDEINRLFEEPEVHNVEKVIEEKITNKQSDFPIANKEENTQTAPPVNQKTIEFSLNKNIAPPLKSQTELKSDNKIIAPLLISINPNPIAASKQRQIISITGTGFHIQQKVKVSWTGKEKILADTQVNMTSDTFMNLMLNVGLQADTWEVTLIDPSKGIESNTLSFRVISNKPATKTKVEQKIIASIEKVSNKNNAGLHGNNWIKQQNKNHFTLQLLGTHNKSTLPAYLKKFSLKDDAAIFKSKRNNKDWYTLIYGSHPNKAAAQAVAKQLPHGVNKPWIRSFASILPALTKPIKTQTSAPRKPLAAKPRISDNQEGWLWSQDPSHYTLQLAAGTDKKAIQDFIKRHKLKNKAVYFHRIRDGKDWYILVYGSYSGYSKAKQAIKQLPAALQKVKPWTRTFAAIHAELN